MRRPVALGFLAMARACETAVHGLGFLEEVRGQADACQEEALGCTLERYDQERIRGWGEPDSEVETSVPVRAKRG